MKASRARPRKHLSRRGVAVAAGGPQAGHLMKCILDITGRTSSAVDKSLFSKYYMLQVQRVYKTLLASSFIANRKVGNGETFSQTS